MLQFQHMNPVDDSVHLETSSMNPEHKKHPSNDLFAVISVALFILLAIGVIIFLYNQNQTLKEKLASYQTAATPTVSIRPSPTLSSEMPNVSSPSANSKVKSPLKVSGTVPAGWMFEGVFPIKLIDSNKKVVAQGQAKEVTAGDWQSGNPVKFTATLTFSLASGSGTLVLENDNPSGIPGNAKSFEIPVSF